MLPRRGYVDALCLFLILGLNPITHFFNLSPRIFSADTIAFMTMGRDFFDKGLLYIPSWVHVHNNLIFPPLYPFLISIGQLFFGETFKVAEWVNSMCALMALIPIYFYLKETTRTAISTATILLIQINYYYFLVGMQPLSEATFLLTLCILIFFVLKLTGNSKIGGKRLSLCLGLVCGLVFLSRQIGIIMFPFLGLISLLQIVNAMGEERKVILKKFFFISLGWFFVIVPYALIIYYQTGQHPLQQNFSANRHETTTNNPDVIAEIQKIESIPDTSYTLIYGKRRLLRKLLPDSSEMLYRVNLKKREKTWYFDIFINNFKSPKNYFSRIYNNFMHLKKVIGGFQIVTFLLFSVSPFFVKSKSMNPLKRLILPLFIFFYIFVISCFTDKILRYSYILFPFVLMHIAVELFVLFHELTRRLRIKLSGILFFAVIYAFFCFFNPRLFNELNLFPKLGEREEAFYSLKKQTNGKPVFSLFPLDAYLLESSLRLLPNDSIEKVVKYGKRTGVRWLLVNRTQSALHEKLFYTNAQWYWSPLLESEYPHLIKFCCKTEDGSYLLYEIL